VSSEQLVVVEDDPVVNTDDRAVADRMIVRGDRRMPFGVVAYVDENLGRACRNPDLVQQRARSGALLVDGHGLAWAAVCVPDRVGPALGDPCEQRLRRQRSLECARG
jgi:hypothetical protein